MNDWDTIIQDTHRKAFDVVKEVDPVTLDEAMKTIIESIGFAVGSGHDTTALPPEPEQRICTVQKRGIKIDRRWYIAPELAQCIGRALLVDLPSGPLPDMLSASTADQTLRFKIFNSETETPHQTAIPESQPPSPPDRQPLRLQSCLDNSPQAESDEDEAWLFEGLHFPGKVVPLPRPDQRARLSIELSWRVGKAWKTHKRQWRLGIPRASSSSPESSLQTNDLSGRLSRLRSAMRSVLAPVLRLFWRIGPSSSVRIP